MTADLLERYADEAALCFNFPNDQLLPGLRQFDWRVVGDQPTYYRIQRPAAAVSDDRSGASGAALRAGVRTYGSLVRASNRALDQPRFGPGRRRGRALRAAGRPDRRALRSRAAGASPRTARGGVRRVRFANPRWDVTTYVARRCGTPVASLVAADRPGSLGLTSVLDVQPMVDPESEREPAFRALLDAVLDDAADSSLVTVPASCYPSTLRRRGSPATTSRRCPGARR